MRITVRFIVAAALGLCLALLGRTASAQTKLAVVDVQRAIWQTEDGARAKAMLTKLYDSRKVELDKRQNALLKQKDELDRLSKSVSPQALQPRVDAWQKQMMELQSSLNDSNKELEKKQKEITDPIFERVVAAIKRLAGTEGYDLIVDRATVAYSRGDLDLTDRIIQLANAAQASTGSAAPKKGSAGPAKP